MRFITFECEIFEIEIEDIFYIWIQNHFGNGFGSRDNCIRVVQNDCCKYAHRQSVNEFPWFQVANLRNHHREA
jgi:hypothetical protein